MTDERMQGRIDEVMDRLASVLSPTGSSSLSYDDFHTTTGGTITLFGRTVYFGTHRDSGRRWSFSLHRRTKI